MKITDLLSVNAVKLNVSASDKNDILKQAVDLMEAQGNVSNKDQYMKAVLAREEESTTGVGDGIAIPHGRCDGITKPGLIAMVIPDGVDYQALDDEPVNLLFLIAADTKSGSAHIDILSKLSGMLMDDAFTAKLKAAKTPEEFLKTIDDAEAAKDAKEAAPKAVAAPAQKKILAVTGCPTGIAHTFMAAEAIEKAATAKGCFVKVETRGSGGAKNVLTDKEIAEADCIIVAADTQVPMARFSGKKLIECPVSDGISKADKLVERAMAGDAPIYSAKAGEKAESSSESKGSVGHQIYKHLMNGVSHMLPFVVGGGILIALAFLFDDYSINPANFGKNTPIAAYLKTVGEISFGMMLPILSGYIAMSIADRPGLAVGIVSGLVAKAGMTFANPAGGDVNAGFLGALFAGFAAGYVILGLKKLTAKIPTSLESVRPMIIYPVLGVLTGAVVTTFINPFVGMINDTLTGALNSMSGTSKVLLGVICAGMQSVDMGGPVNKAAYVFGTASIASYVFATSQLAEGNFEIMAAVMAGGMIPPLAIALCTTFFKNRFTKKERESGLVNYLLGFSFISEGAIPFAASDPLRVLPACIIGSATAGGLSMAFGCTLRAPHGGIFVLPTIGHPLLYFLCLLIGSVVGCAILAILKKPLENPEL